MISAFYFNTSTRQTRLMQMLCQGFQSHLYWFTTLNNTTVTLRQKRTETFLGKMIYCWIGAGCRRIRTKCRFLPSSVQSLASSEIQQCLMTALRRALHQHLLELILLLLLGIRHHTDDLYKATQTGIPVLPPPPYLPKACFQASAIPSLCWQKSLCSYRAKQTVELIWTQPNTLPSSPSLLSFLRG